jgi:hypothetical protein
MATFRLTNINLQTTPKFFTADSQKILKVEITEPKLPRTIELKSPAEVINQGSLAWHEPIVLPAKLDKKFRFEILSQDSSQLGSNPETSDAILEGHIVIKKD